MRIILDLPWPYLLLCLLCGAAYAAVFYFLGRRTDSFSRPVRWGLAAVRFLAVALIASLLLAPMVKREVHQKEKPIILVAQDNSQSIALAGDSLELSPTLKELERDYELHCYTFGESLREGATVDYHEAATDMAAALSDLRSRYEGRNVGALLLVSDGIFNQGLNPVSLCEGSPYPIYAVGMGDTAVRRDAAVVHLRYNRLAYLGNQFPLEATVGATKLKGNTRTLTVQHNGRTLYSKPITYTSDDFSATESIILTADQPGLQSYTVRIAECDGEVSTVNNQRTITIEVIDGHEKVLILAASPHPDVAALRQALEANQNYEVATSLLSDFHGRLSDYDLLVLHNLPSHQAEVALPPQVPVLFVLGQQTDLQRFNNLHLGLEIVARIAQFNESFPQSNQAFALFSIRDDLMQRIEGFPPLLSPFGDYRHGANTQSIITARIGTVQSGLPLVAFSQKGGTRYGFICGEGVWRWRLADYASNQSHEAFNTLVTKAVVYTSMKAGKERFHVEAKALYRAGEEVTIDASLYDDNFELVNGPEVELTLEGKKYLFNRTGSAYSLNLGTLDPGNYSYTATTTFNRQRLTAHGTFSVEELQIEDLTLVANHGLLNTLAQQTGGRLLPKDSLALLPQWLRERDDVRTVIYSHTRYSSLLDLPWLFLLILLLLGGEWIIRKYHGEI